MHVERWSEVAAVCGTGSLLLGPHPRGAQALVPPAVIALTPRGSAEPYCDEGWRVAVWEFGSRDDGRVVASRPVSVDRVEVGALIALVSGAPARRRWLEKQVRLRLAVLELLLRQASMGAERLLELRAESDELLLDAIGVFGPEWVDRRHGRRGEEAATG